MQSLRTFFGAVQLLEPTVHEDERGFFVESYNAKAVEKLGIPASFVQDNHSYSKKAGVLRGLHYQLHPMAQGKLVRVLAGAIYDVFVDLRKSSSTYGQWDSVILTSDNQRQVFIPAGFAHGFCTLTPHTHVFYKVDQYYSLEHDRGISWNDPALSIDWPVSHPILSEKDQKHPLLSAAELNF